MSDVHTIAHELALRVGTVGIRSIEDARAWIEAECRWRQRFDPRMLEHVAIALYRQCNPIAPTAMGVDAATDG